jgi:uncharacterized membrane protein
MPTAPDSTPPPNHEQPPRTPPTNSGKDGWGDTQVEQVIGHLLRTGVIMAAVVVMIGGIVYLAHYGLSHPDYRLFRGEPTELRSVSGTFQFALAGRRRGIIQFGLLLLIATPIARVVFSVYAFARERDWLYVGLTLVVLAVLLFSLFFSH